MTSQDVRFPGVQGNALAARLDLPAAEPQACALFAHCFTCGKDLPAAARLARALTERGLAVLRFDFTGLGQSEGDFAATSFSSNVGDLLAAAEYLRKRRQGPSLLVGHSLGGAAVLAAAPRIPEVQAVATIGAPSEPAHVRHLIQGAEGEIDQKGEAEISIGGRPFRIRRQFLEDIERRTLLECLPDLKAAALVLHAPEDEIVGIENAHEIFDALTHSRSLVSLAGADHLLRKVEDATYAANLIGTWAERYL